MPRLTVDGACVEVEAGTTVLQACEAAGAEIPRFCYHERLSIAGNCRMCLVEMEKSPKPIASCAMPAADGMVIHTATPAVRKAREGVMEFLLLNHPLDCPICDQGGECDLQDQAMAYGVDASRFAENKRAVEDKDMGPLIKTVMTRCIHCTRCVRFAAEVAGVAELGAIGRGEDMEIVTWLDRAVGSEMSGNMIDLCPVGALTSRPHAFMARSWEMRKTRSVDVMDALGSNICVDARGRQVMRILPRLNDDVNEEWISDKTRFVWDGLGVQRLDRPFVRRGGVLREASWDEALARVAEEFLMAGGARTAAIAGDMACAESLKAWKDLMDALGSPHLDCRQDGAQVGCPGPDGSVARGGYLFNSGLAGVEEADALLLVGVNPRTEAAVLNARILKRWRQTDMPIAAIGPAAELPYRVETLGRGPQTLARLAGLADGGFSGILRSASRPMIIVGMGALARPDGAAVLDLCVHLARATGVIADHWNGFNVLHLAAARVAGLDLGFLPGPGGRNTAAIARGAQEGEIKAVCLLGADEMDLEPLRRAFVVYQGSHGDAGAHHADVILPGAAWTEKDALWVNTEGRVQQGRRAVFPPGLARDDWTIVRALSSVMDKALPYDTLASLRRAMVASAPHMAALDDLPHAAPPEAAADAEAAAAALLDAPFRHPVRDFYLTNSIARASRTLAACSRLAAARNAGAAAGHG